MRFNVTNAIYPALALTAGAALAIQVAFNGKLKVHVGTPMQATMFSFAIGLVATTLICLLARYPWPQSTSLTSAPWWAWCGGLLGVVYLCVGVIVAPRIGVAPMLGLVVAGQMLTAMILDHFGLLAVPVNPVSVWRLLGVGLVLAGVTVMATSK